MFAGGLQTSAQLLVLVPGWLALLSLRMARPLGSLLDRPSARFAGVGGDLARHNTMRNPKRTANRGRADHRRRPGGVRRRPVSP
jgi:hypothetical protein